MHSICHELWDMPQVNWDGKVLGCCRNFWGDFGGNAFTDGLIESLNNEKIAYARKCCAGRPRHATTFRAPPATSTWTCARKAAGSNVMTSTAAQPLRREERPGRLLPMIRQVRWVQDSPCGEMGLARAGPAKNTSIATDNSGRSLRANKPLHSALMLASRMTRP
jgi:hypothetical protein